MAAGIGQPTGIRSSHAGGANVATADGRVIFLPEIIATEQLQAFITAHGGESARWP